MAIVQFSNLVETIRGKMQGDHFKRSPHGHVLKGNGRTQKLATPLQSNQRAGFQLQAQVWRNLTPAERNMYYYDIIAKVGNAHDKGGVPWSAFRELLQMMSIKEKFYNVSLNQANGNYANTMMKLFNFFQLGGAGGDLCTSFSGVALADHISFKISCGCPFQANSSTTAIRYKDILTFPYGPSPVGTINLQSAFNDAWGYNSFTPYKIPLRWCVLEAARLSSGNYTQRPSKNGKGFFLYTP